MPGEPHEIVKKRIAALLELYLLMAGFNFTPTGSMTLENETAGVKREADESYKLAPGRRLPDLAIDTKSGLLTPVMRVKKVYPQAFGKKKPTAG